MPTCLAREIKFGNEVATLFASLMVIGPLALSPAMLKPLQCDDHQSFRLHRYLFHHPEYEYHRLWQQLNT